MPKPLKTLFNVVSLGVGSVLSLMGASWMWETFISRPETPLIDGTLLAPVLTAIGAGIFYAGYRGAQKASAADTAAKNTPPSPSP